MKNKKFRLRRGITLLFLFAFFASQTFAQVTVSGVVKDGETGEPLPGVNVVVQGTTTGTVTDLDGKYTLGVSDANASLLFSYIGYLSETVAISGRSVIDMSLNPDIQSLDEVVVVGYGTMKKSDLTGAVSSLNEEDIKNVKSSNAVEALQGKIAGIDMTRSDGRAGSGYSVLIRGERSFSASNDPIYIVDGIDFGSSVNINPNDIESMEVLKDASSTAIYGSRGANGVILITTKKGSKGNAVVSFNTYYGVTTPLGKLPVGDRDYYLQMMRDTQRGNRDMWDATDEEMDAILATTLTQNELEGFLNGTDFDWIAEQMEDYGTQQDYHLSVTGGNENTSYSISANQFTEDNYIANDNYKRYSVKSNIDSDVSKYFKMGNSTFLSYTKNERGVGIDYNQNPLVVPYDSLENIIAEPNAKVPFENPMINIDPDYRLNEIYQTRIFSTFYAQLNILNGLTFRTSLNADLNFKREGYYQGEYPGLDRLNSASVELNNIYKYTWTNILTYDKTFDIHHLIFTGATETMYNRKERIGQSGSDLELGESYWYTLSTVNPELYDLPWGDMLTENSMVSFIGRIHYGLMEKYLITASARYDGASQLRNKWDFFPSASAAWRISEEDFLKGNSTISNLKLRVGYGVTGNQSVDPYSSMGSIITQPMYYEFGEPEVGYYGFRTGQLDTYSKWESTASLNIGVDFGILNNRFSGSLEYYKSHTYDILQEVTLPPTSAVSSVVENIGESKGNGIEASLNATIISSSDFKWTANITFSRSRDEITYLAGGVTQDIANGWFVGEPISVFYDWKKIGIWQETDTVGLEIYNETPGDIKILDLEYDSVINDADRMVLGTERPKWTGGLQTTFTYKSFDLSAFFYARIGQMIRDDVLTTWSPDGRENSMIREYWTPLNKSNEFPRVNPSQTRSGWSEATTLCYVDGSFIKIKDITLGYALPKSFINKGHISSARIYLTAKNAFVFGKFFSQGRLDPEDNGDMSFPIPKMYAIGANITF